MQSPGSGAIFECICRNKHVKQALQKVDYAQLVDITNFQNNILDPLTIGHAHKNGLKVCLKACDKG